MRRARENVVEIRPSVDAVRNNAECSSGIFFFFLRKNFEIDLGSARKTVDELFGVLRSRDAFKTCFNSVFRKKRYDTRTKNLKTRRVLKIGMSKPTLNLVSLYDINIE